MPPPPSRDTVYGVQKKSGTLNKVTAAVVGVRVAWVYMSSDKREPTAEPPIWVVSATAVYLPADFSGTGTDPVQSVIRPEKVQLPRMAQATLCPVAVAFMPAAPVAQSIEFTFKVLGEDPNAIADVWIFTETTSSHVNSGLFVLPFNGGRGLALGLGQ
jgi:hypothetical protein